MKAPILTATTARIWVHFLALFGALEKREHIVSKYSMYSKQNIWFFCHNHTVPDLQAFNSWSLHCSHRSSFSVWNFGSCPISHVAYLKLTRKQMMLQAEQIYKMTYISLKMVKVVILSENNCHFVSCSACKNSFLSLR